jgi:hypothetical protein
LDCGGMFTSEGREEEAEGRFDFGRLPRIRRLRLRLLVP